MRAGSHRVLATRCLPLCTAGFSFWLLQKNSSIFCVQIFLNFFLTKLTPFPLEELIFACLLLLCQAKPACGSYQPLHQCQQASGNNIPQILTFL